MEDSARLAECYNTFDDSDSWPGGFTGGNPFTAERIFDDKKKSQDIRILVAYSGDKIVGHCNVCDGELDEESAYVGILGVDPSFQGQGYGKDMLIEAAETAARAGKRRIDLHTWGGNLKAMPLYKRTGYNWVPDTRVLMESHVPGILNAPLFNEFFERYFWYEVMKREIRQDVDDIVEDGIGVFKYNFEGNNGDALEVSIDREVKGICAFSLTMDGKSISAEVRPKAHRGYIGFGDIPFEFKISNDYAESLNYSVDVKPMKALPVNIEGTTNGIIDAAGQVIIRGTYSIPIGSRSIDREINPDEKVPSQAEWTLIIAGKTINLYSGLIARNPISISSSPQFPIISPGESTEIGVGLRNNTDRILDGVVNLRAPEKYDICIKSTNFSINPGEGIELPIELEIDSAEPNGVLPITVSLKLTENGTTTEITKTLDVGILGVKGAIAYKSLDNYLVLESESFRILINEYPPMAVRRIDNKILGIESSGWGLLPDIGYPFSSGGSEWDRKEFHVDFQNTPDYAEIKLTGESTERPGLVMKVIYRINVGTQYLDIRTDFKNTGDTKLENLGVKLGGWFSNVGDVLVVPCRGSLYELSSLEWLGGRVLSKKPEDYHESWSAVQSDTRGLLGYIWDASHISTVSVQRKWSFPRLEYKIPDIESGGEFGLDVLKMAIGQGDWRQVRGLYARLNGLDLESASPLELRSDLEVGIVPESQSLGRLSDSVFLVDRAKSNSMELRIQVIIMEKFSGKLTLRMPEGVLVNGIQEISADIKDLSLDNPFKHPITISVGDDSAWIRKGGEILLEFKNRVVRLPLSMIIFDSEAEVHRTVETKESLDLHSTVVSGIRMAVSPDYSASLVRFGPVDESSIFYDTFPRADPLVWDDRHFSGVTPRLIGSMVWDWQTALPKEVWSVSVSEDEQWVGYELTSTLKHCPRIKGMGITIRYKLLKGTPLLSAEIQAHNSTVQWNRFSFGLQGVPRPGEKKQSLIHSVHGSQQIVYEPTEVGGGFNPPAKEGWLAYQDVETGRTLGIVSPIKGPREVLRYTNTGPAGQWISLGDTRKLKPEESTSLSFFLMTVKDPEDVKSLKGLR